MELAEHNSSVDISSLEDQLSVLQTEKESVERAVRELQEELTRATKQAEMRGAIKELKKEKAKREEQLATMYVHTYVCAYVNLARDSPIFLPCIQYIV